MILAFMFFNIPFFSFANSFDYHDFAAKFDISEVLESKPQGTPPREENEFKRPVFGSEYILGKNSYLIAKIKSAIARSLSNDLLWQAPQITDSNYYLMKVGMGTFCFLDIYLDDENSLNYRNGISYRVRYRWHSRSALFRYLLGSENPADFPHRCEYQLKIYTQAWKDSFNNCLETRFEYRNESFPFKADNSCPPPPWPFEEYIKPAITGVFGQHNVMTPMKYARHLQANLQIGGKIGLKPSLIIVTTRRRVHLGLKNEFGMISAQKGFGSAVNADQVILTTLDSSEIYYPSDFLNTYIQSRMALSCNSLTPRLRKRLKKQLKPVARFTEAEFELERNIESAISYLLEQSRNEAETERLKKTKQFFLNDVRTISEVIAKELSSLGLKVGSAEKSKYQQAWEALYLSAQ